MAGALSARRIVLTGGTGYLGCRLIPWLLARGHALRALTRESSRQALSPDCEAVSGHPLDSATFIDRVRGCDTLVQLVGVPKPAPWKGAQFRAIDRASGLASIQAAQYAGVTHVVYVSVAHEGRHRPAPRNRIGLALCEQVPSLRSSALRLGLVTLEQMLATLVWSVEHPPESVRVIEVPEIKRLGGLEP